MNSKIPNAKVLGLAVIFAMSQAAWAGKLDADFIQTSPTKALVYSIAFPGAGYYYLSGINSKYKGKTYLFLALGIGSAVFLGTQLKNGNSSMLLPAAAAACGVKLWEFGAVTNDAEAERFKWLRENFKASNADDASVKGLEKKIFLKDGSVIAGESVVF